MIKKLLKLSVDILEDLFGRYGKTLGVLNTSLERLERICKIISVADTLVCNDLHINYTAGYHLTVIINDVLSSSLTVSDKHGKITKIVYVVVYRLYTERTHTCYYERAVEGAELCKSSRQKAEIIEEAEKLYSPAK